MCDFRQIYYQAKDNKFIDEFGWEIPNIHRIIDPNMVYLLKTNKQDMLCYSVHGEFLELIYERDNEIN